MFLFLVAALRVFACVCVLVLRALLACFHPGSSCMKALRLSWRGDWEFDGFEALLVLSVGLLAIVVASLLGCSAACLLACSALWLVGFLLGWLCWLLGLLACCWCRGQFDGLLQVGSGRLAVVPSGGQSPMRGSPESRAGCLPLLPGVVGSDVVACFLARRSGVLSSTWLPF